MTPLRFLRALYCVDSDLRPLRGSEACQRGCPAAPPAQPASRPPTRRCSRPPALPCTLTRSPRCRPTCGSPNEPDYAELAAMPTCSRRSTAFSAHTARHPIPDLVDRVRLHHQPAQRSVHGHACPAAYYLNWSEYLTWQDPRIRSYDQYLLTDPSASTCSRPGCAPHGKPKPTFAAYRMPLYLPVTRPPRATRSSSGGGVRPAPGAADATHRPQIEIQFRPHSGTTSRPSSASRSPTRTATSSCARRFRIRFGAAALDLPRRRADPQPDRRDHAQLTSSPGCIRGAHGRREYPQLP